MTSRTSSAVDLIADLVPSGSRFMRGLAIGAIVGAAIAGSTIWERRKARSRLRELSAGSPADRLDELVPDPATDKTPGV